MTELEFYNKQFEKYGRYDRGSHESKTYDMSNPEDYFESLVHRISSKDKTLVDLGCGDGLFTATLAPLNRRVVGVEPSNLINIANSNREMHIPIVAVCLLCMLCLLPGRDTHKQDLKKELKPEIH